MLNNAMKKRKQAETNCNDFSSRSHLIIKVGLVGTREITNEIKNSTLTMVDLAGSERVKESGVVG